MSNVIAFPKRPPPEPVQRFPPITPWPAWKYALRDRYWGRDNWRTSQKGNLYVVIDGRCVTWFRQRDGWSWSISVSGSNDEPLWSKRLHASERDARTDAWDTLVTFYEGPNESDGRTTP
jgi:hypothetical protein